MQLKNYILRSLSGGNNVSKHVTLKQKFCLKYCMPSASLSISHKYKIELLYDYWLMPNMIANSYVNAILQA